MPTSTFTGRSFAPALAVALLGGGCAITSQPTHQSELGVSRPYGELLAVIDEPGPVEVETVASADWVADRKGLLNLDHPRARAAGIRAGEEPIQIYFHALRHPSGLYLVDTGVERALRDQPSQAAIRGVAASFLHLEKLSIRAALGDWLASRGERLRGVLLTHLHPDHVAGMADVPAGTPVYMGPGEVTRGVLEMIARPTMDRALDGKPLRSWAMTPQAGAPFDGVLDVLGDRTVWALWVPGHTPGSTAYLVRTPKGPVLLVGDACHTRWGWEHDVEPGTFSKDIPHSVESLARLRRLAAEHPAMVVRLGHQP